MPPLVLVWLFLALLLLAALRVIAASRWRMMLRAHLLLMMHLLIHPVLIHPVLIHRMLIRPMLVRCMLVHCMLPSVFSHVVGVRFCLVSTDLLLVAVNIFSLLRVPLVVTRMFVPMFFASHSCSLALMFSGRVSSFVFTFSRSGCPSGCNAVGLIK